MNALLQKAPHIARYVLGTIFFVFGLNGFLHFLPQPPMSGAPAEFVQALMASGYVLPVLKGSETVAGALLLSNSYVPLALAVLAPAVVGIVGFHVLLAPAGLPIALLVLVLELYLARAYKNAFAPMLEAHTAPSRQASITATAVAAR
jgi:hypothetical protein